MSNAKDELTRLLDVMSALRDPSGGCPWDLKQTFDSIVPYTIEEAYEVADAIASGDREEIKQECGDLLFQVVFYAQIAKEEGSFDFYAVAQAIADKLIRRHPHVFRSEANENHQASTQSPTQAVLSAEQLNQQWEKIKQQELAGKHHNNRFFANVPSGLPALKLATKLQKACAKVGFDWPNPAPVLDKVKEEIDEIEEAMQKNQHSNNASQIEEEIGDALFALVNLSRHYNIDADNALRKASHKFKQRFEHVESTLTKKGKPLASCSLEQMETAWQQAKRDLA